MGGRFHLGEEEAVMRQGRSHYELSATGQRGGVSESCFRVVRELVRRHMPLCQPRSTRYETSNLGGLLAGSGSFTEQSNWHNKVL